MKQYVAYYRVSTKKQGRSGIGLEAQKQAVLAFLEQQGGRMAGEFVEAQKGSRNTRVELAKALALAHRTKATLVIAKLDRLTRNYFFCRDLMEAKVEFVCCDQPYVDKFTVHILAAVAEKERDLISERTRYSNRIRRERGGLLGARHPNTPPISKEAQDLGRAKSIIINQAAARLAYADLVPSLIDMRYRQGLSFQAVARELNARGEVTRGGLPWNGVQVRRVLARLGS